MKTLSDIELQRCYAAMAEITSKYGEKYLPLFKLIHDEVEKRKVNSNLMLLAKKIILTNNKP